MIAASIFVAFAIVINGRLISCRSSVRRNARSQTVDSPKSHSTAYACEGQMMNITCPKGYWINVIGANYGRFSLNICNEKQMEWADTQCSNPKSTQVMKERCSNRTQCILEPATIQEIGDTCPGVEKYLETQYTCVFEPHFDKEPFPGVITTTKVVNIPSYGTESSDHDDFTTATDTEKITSTLKSDRESTITDSTKYCSGQLMRDIKWPRTKGGVVAKRPCPGNTGKLARWKCCHEGMWMLKPDVSDCSSADIDSIVKNFNQAKNFAAKKDLVSGLYSTTIEGKNMFGRDIIAVADLLDNLTQNKEMYLNKDPYALNQHFNTVVAILDNFLDDSRNGSWQDLPNDKKTIAASKIINCVEHSGLILSSSFNNKTINMSKITLKISNFPIPVIYTPFQIGSLNNIIEMPPEAFNKTNCHVENQVKFIYASFEGLGSYMDTWKSENGSSKIVASNIISASIPNCTVMDLSNLIKITFAIKEYNKLSSYLCVYWKSNNSQGGHWSDNGCKFLSASNKSHVVCECNHLSAFSVIFFDADDEKRAHQPVLEWFTKVGCIVSIAALILSLLILSLFKLYGERATIHKNLCFCLIVAQLTFLLGINNVGFKVTCSIVAAVLHYFFLAAFAWMLLEGFQLYVLFVEVFESNDRHRKKYYYGFSYGVPLIIVAVSLSFGMENYGTDKRCWLNSTNDFIYTFIGPVIVILMINFFFLFMALIVMCKHSGSWEADYRKRKFEKSHVPKFGLWLKSSFTLIILLGLTWIFGLLDVVDQTMSSFLFTIFNSLQGFFIFVFHILLNDKLHIEYRKWLRRSDWLPDWFRSGSLLPYNDPASNCMTHMPVGIARHAPNDFCSRARSCVVAQPFPLATNCDSLKIDANVPSPISCFCSTTQTSDAMGNGSNHGLLLDRTNEANNHENCDIKLFFKAIFSYQLENGQDCCAVYRTSLTYCQCCQRQVPKFPPSQPPLPQMYEPRRTSSNRISRSLSNQPTDWTEEQPTMSASSAYLNCAIRRLDSIPQASPVRSDSDSGCCCDSAPIACQCDSSKKFVNATAYLSSEIERSCNPVAPASFNNAHYSTSFYYYCDGLCRNGRSSFDRGSSLKMTHSNDLGAN